MTRVNVVPVSELSDLHLVAEYREITRLPGSLRRSLNRKSRRFTTDEIPDDYVLGEGHVKFFYDKGLFLQKRYDDILDEMKKRGFKPKFTDSKIFFHSQEFHNDYMPTDLALEINRRRINERSRNRV